MAAIPRVQGSTDHSSPHRVEASQLDLPDSLLAATVQLTPRENSTDPKVQNTMASVIRSQPESNRDLLVMQQLCPGPITVLEGSKLNVPHNGVLEMIQRPEGAGACAQHKGNTLKPTLLHALSRMKESWGQNKPQQFAEFCLANVDNFYVIHIASALNILAEQLSLDLYQQFTIDYPVLLYRFERRVTALLPQIVPSCMSQMVRAYGKLQIKNSQFLNLLLEDMQQNIFAYEPRHIANTLWGVSQLNFKNQNWLDVTCAHAQERISHFNSEELSSVIFSLSKLEITYSRFVESISKEIYKKIVNIDPELKLHHLVNVASAFASFKTYDILLMNAIQQLLERNLSSVSPHNLVKVANAFTSFFSVGQAMDLEFLNKVLMRISEVFSKPRNLKDLSFVFFYLEGQRFPLDQKLLKLKHVVDLW